MTSRISTENYSILRTHHYPDLGSASDWLNQISHAVQPIKTTQISVVTRHQYGISVLISQTPFGGETSGSVAKCRLFFQAIKARGQGFPSAIFTINKRKIEPDRLPSCSIPCPVIAYTHILKSSLDSPG